MENKKYVIGAVVIITLLGVGFLMGKKSAVAPGAPVNGDTPQVAATSSSTGTTSTKKTVTPSSPAVKTTVAPAPRQTSDGTYIVSYTNSGFVPASITIKVGKSVHFVNNSTRAMSITTTTTSNQDQAAFNQGKTVGQGGTYDFTFTAPGEWWYMNRNNQSDIAKIIVTQ